jgi:ABC-type transport system involved in multi-copper enzyme maturation permease subunit
MNWLFWKDYRENRLVVFATAGFLLVPHLFVLYALCEDSIHGGANSRTWIDGFGASSMFSLFISQLAIALIGGNAIAGERADRSAEFLASLPIPRNRIVTSKLLLSLAIIGVIWLMDGPALLYLTAHGAQPIPRPDEILWVLGGTAIVAMMFFGVSWLLSSFLSSPTFSVVGGLLTPALLWAGILFACYLFHVEGDYNRWLEDHVLAIVFSYFGLCLALAPVCFVAGTWYYLRRVEP